MKNCRISFILTAIALGVAIFLWENFAKSGRQPAPRVLEPVSPSNPIPANKPATSSIVKSASGQAAVQPPPLRANQTEKWKWLADMEGKDRYFEYKAPISFYGRVIDDASNALAGVVVDLSWTDASEATGASAKTVVSDNNGFFSIEGIHGKALLIMNLSKPDYTKSIKQNQFTFNYGWFPDPSYFSPDPMNPVMFIMRKNQQGERLIVRRRQEARIEPGQVRSFPVGGGDVSISVERLPNDTQNTRYWNAEVTVPGGVLQLTTEEFPFKAPEDGYTNAFTITNGLSVKGNQGGMFYVKTPTGYGRAMVYYVPNMPWVYVESWFNPDSPSRNLEVDPNNVEIIKP